MRFRWLPSPPRFEKPAFSRSTINSRIFGGIYIFLHFEHAEHRPNCPAIFASPRLGATAQFTSAGPKKLSASNAIADDQSAIPALLRPTMQALLDEIRVLETRIAQLERQLAAVARESNACKLLMSVPGIGLLTSTGITAATSGSVSHFTNERHFASWFGLTSKEHSSGGTRTLGRISVRGDKYLRMLLTHGALRTASGRRQFRKGAGGHGHSPLGARFTTAHKPQQSHLYAGQQAGANLLRGAARSNPFRSAHQAPG